MMHLIQELDATGRPIDGSVLEQTITYDTHGAEADTLASDLLIGYRALGFAVRLMTIHRPA